MFRIWGISAPSLTLRWLILCSREHSNELAAQPEDMIGSLRVLVILVRKGITLAAKTDVQWGHPGALGLAGFGLNTILLQIHNLGLIDGTMPLIYGLFWEEWCRSSPA